MIEKDRTVTEANKQEDKQVKRKREIQQKGSDRALIRDQCGALNSSEEEKADEEKEKRRREEGKVGQRRHCKSLRSFSWR